MLLVTYLQLTIMFSKLSSLIFLLSLLLSCNAQATPTTNKKIVLLAGAKSHGPKVHEYIKSVRLLKVMLDHSNVEGIKTEIHYNGWPEDPATLEDADLILTISDGQDGHLGNPVPFMTPDRMAFLQKQIDRGCGFMTFHFSTFAPDDYGQQILEWGGGYFDWQAADGSRKWYSDIKTLKTGVEVSDDHPIGRGVGNFELKEEFYYQIRFREEDQRLQPLVWVPALKNDQKWGNVVAWAVERKDGGRGFGTTMGHFYSNWKVDAFRKLILNAIVWTAGAEVPAQGVDARFYTDTEVTQLLFGKQKKGLILTGNNHPAHDWKKTTAVLRRILEKGPEFHVDVSTNIEDLHQYDLEDYAFLVMNYCNWKDPRQLSKGAKEQFTNYLEQGGGLLLIHFANGAFHFSLPEAAASDWPEYRNICRRVWNHEGKSGHDAYGTFEVNIADAEHPITAGLNAFTTTDELYYHQEGNEKIVPLLTAVSKDTGKAEPIAWTYEYGNGRVFQLLLGHDVASFEAKEIRDIIQRAAIWAARFQKH